MARGQQYCDEIEAKLDELALVYIAARAALLASLDVEPTPENPTPVTTAYKAFDKVAYSYDAVCLDSVMACINYPDAQRSSKRINVRFAAPMSPRIYTTADRASWITTSLTTPTNTEAYYTAKARVMEVEDYLIATNQKLDKDDGV